MIEKDDNLKYSVTAFIDLQGISSHLEVGYDLRTTIGKQIINRLETLEKAIEIINIEKKKFKKCFPSIINIQRLNDALIICIDLPDELIPNTGETNINGFNTGQLSKILENEELTDVEKLNADLKKIWDKKLSDISLFVGLIARVHSFINFKESESHFPGAKTVISTGLRKQFFINGKQDFLSANFSFSNAYLAEKSLKGPTLFIDEYLIRILSMNKMNSNFIKFSLIKESIKKFDPFNNSDFYLSLGNEKVETDTFELNILRKKYCFREINHKPLCYLQYYNYFLEFEMSKKISKSHPLFKIFNLLKPNYENFDQIKACMPSFIYMGFDLSTSLGFFTSKKDNEICRENNRLEYERNFNLKHYGINPLSI